MSKFTQFWKHFNKSISRNFLLKEIKKYKSAADFVWGMSQAFSVYDIREFFRKEDSIIAQLMNLQDEKDNKIRLDNKRFEPQMNTRQIGQAVRGVNDIDKRLFTETRRALTDFYNKNK